MPYKSIAKCAKSHGKRKRKAHQIEELSKLDDLVGVGSCDELHDSTISRRQVQYHRQKKRKIEEGKISPRDNRTILLDQERIDLAQFAKASADAHDPQYKPLLRAKVQEILANRKRRGRGKYSRNRRLSELALTTAEVRCMQNPSKSPSDEWFNSFFGEFKEHIPLRTVVHKDIKRIVTCNVETIDQHFYSNQGILSTLIDCGIFDPSTGTFDPSRIGNMDETCEFFFYEQSTKTNKCKVPSGSRKGPVVAAQHDQRETYTVNMIIGADGFMYGPQIIFNTEQLTSAHDVTDELPLIGFSRSDPFDNSINESMSCSSFLLVSPTSSGVQTTVSLKHRLDMFHRELLLRKVQLPFVLMLDNHKTRFNEEVARWCLSHKGDIILWVASPNTTSWSQALDQMNHRFHQFSYKAKCEYANQMSLRYNCRPYDVKFHQKDILLSFRMFWFHWWNKTAILEAFRHVGFVGGRIDPLQLEDQNGFFGSSEESDWFTKLKNKSDTGSANSKPLRVVPSFMDTEDLRNQIEALKCRCPIKRHTDDRSNIDDTILSETLKLIDKYNELVLFVEKSPTTHGILTVPARPKMSDRAVRLEKGASMTTEQIHLERVRKADEAKIKLKEKEDKSNARKEKKEREDKAKMERSVRYDICKIACVCGQNCDMPRMRKCPYCGDIKPNVCRKTKCTLTREKGMPESLGFDSLPLEESQDFSLSASSAHSVDIPASIDTSPIEEKLMVVSHPQQENSQRDTLHLMLLRSQKVAHETQRLMDNHWRQTTNLTDVVAKFETYRRSGNHRSFSPVTGVTVSLEDFLQLRPVSRRDVCSPSRWINDQIVDFVSLALRVREVTKRRVLQSGYQSKYVGTAVMWACIRRAFGDDTEMGRICQRFAIRPFSFKTLIFPVNLNCNHWVFMVIKTEQKLVVGYNSLASSFKSEVMPHLLFWLEKEAHRLRRKFNRDEWSFEMHSQCPQQRNSVDCGIMMMTGMLCTCDDLQLTFRQEHMNFHRIRWAADILEGKIADVYPPPTEQDRKDASCMDSYASIYPVDESSQPLG